MESEIVTSISQFQFRILQELWKSEVVNLQLKNINCERNICEKNSYVQRMTICAQISDSMNYGVYVECMSR